MPIGPAFGWSGRWRKDYRTRATIWPRCRPSRHLSNPSRRRLAADKVAGGAEHKTLEENLELTLEAFERGQSELAKGNRVEGRRWLDRAYRFAPQDKTLA